ERDRYLQAFGDFAEPGATPSILAFVLSADVRGQDLWKPLRGLLANPATQSEAWSFVKANWTELRKKGGSVGAQRIIGGTKALWRTDLHIVEGELPPAKRSVVPGHEVVGIVDRVGSRVLTVKEGDRVGIAWLQHTCGTCEFCLSKQENLCLQARFTGYHVDGGYAEYAVVPADYAYLIPNVFGDEEAAPL